MVEEVWVHPMYNFRGYSDMTLGEVEVNLIFNFNFIFLFQIWVQLGFLLQIKENTQHPVNIELTTPKIQDPSACQLN